ncbi:MAG: ArsR/SmtB family transcription factor [Anaerolineae bacterium]
MDPYKLQSDMLKALAHPMRLRILEILSKREACVCHLTAVLEQRQPYISQQLMSLREAGLVVDRKDGVMVYYRLAGPGVAEALTATRELLLVTGTLATFPPVAEGPVNGCPCPQCGGEGACST